MLYNNIWKQLKYHLTTLWIITLITKDNITITLTTNDDKTNPEEQLKKLNKLFFKIGCFEHSFKSFELTKIIQLKKKLGQSIYFY